MLKGRTRLVYDAGKRNREQNGIGEAVYETEAYDRDFMNDYKNDYMKDFIIEGCLFTRYSRQKLKLLSQSYRELARLYGDIPTQADPKSPGSEGRMETLSKQRLCDTKTLFSKHLENISGAISDVADTLVSVSVPLEHKRKKLIQFLHKKGIAVRELMFIEGGECGVDSSFHTRELSGRDGYGTLCNDYGTRISIEAKLIWGDMMSASQLCELLSEFFNRPLVASNDAGRVLGRAYDTFIFEDEPRFTIMSALSKATKEDERVSGDNFSIEEYHENQAVLMISDGMGSGESACKDSLKIIEFMERMLEAGFAKEKSFMMVNGAYAAQNGCMNLTTLDMAAINLFTGETEFIKAGAAPSYVLKGGEVIEIASDSLPIGAFINQGFMTQQVWLNDSDMLIMMSDGVTNAVEESGRDIKEIIAHSGCNNPKELSEYLLRLAIGATKGRVMDDMTILVVKIWKKY